MVAVNVGVKGEQKRRHTGRIHNDVYCAELLLGLIEALASLKCIRYNRDVNSPEKRQRFNMLFPK